MWLTSPDQRAPERTPAAAEAISALALAHVSKQFVRSDDSLLEVLRDVNFDVRRGEIVSILGPSGSGKSTLLNLAAGLIAPDQGQVLVMGQPTTGSVDWLRLGYMFQDDRLLPWRIAIDNVALALEAGSTPARERNARARMALASVGLADFATSYPHQLSGGMRSRVAMARSLVTEPEIVLMDEPFSRLDAQTRASMHEEILRIHASRALSILFVTHDVEEAVILSSRIVMFSPRPGRVHRIVDVPFAHPRIDTPQTRDLVAELRSTVAGMKSSEDPS